LLQVLKHFFAVSALSILPLSLGNGEVTNDIPPEVTTDIVVVLDTSRSMGISDLFDPVKSEILGLAKNEWSTDPNSRLYFFTFDERLRPARAFDLGKGNGFTDFETYLNNLRAKGSSTCLVDSLKNVLDTIPQMRSQEGRTGGHVEYFLLTDGSENCDGSDAKVTNGSLASLLVEWGEKLESQQRNEYLFLLRLGAPKGADDIRIQAITEEAVKTAQEKGVPVEQVTTSDELSSTMATVREALTPDPVLNIVGHPSGLAIITEGGTAKTISVPLTLQGEYLSRISKAAFPSAQIYAELEGLDGAPVKLGSDRTPITEGNWEELVRSGTTELDISITFDPVNNVDVDGRGALVLHLVLPDATVTSLDDQVSIPIKVSSSGRAEVRVSGEQLKGGGLGTTNVGRTDLAEQVVTGTLLLDWDPAAKTRGGEIAASLELDPGIRDSIGLNVEIASDQQSLQYSMVLPKGTLASTVKGEIVISAANCELVLPPSGGSSPVLRIPWSIKPEAAPPSLVTLEGDFPPNGFMTTEMANPEDQDIVLRKQIGFRSNTEAERKAIEGKAEIVIQSRRSVGGAPWPSGMKFLLDGQEGTIHHTRLDAVTCELIIPHDTPSGTYQGHLTLHSDGLKIAAPGLGQPVAVIDLDWEVIVGESALPVVVIGSPLGSYSADMEYPLTGPSTTEIPIQVRFNEKAKRMGAEVLVSLSPEEYFANEGQVLLTPNNPSGRVKLSVPSGTYPGDLSASLVFSTKGAQFESGDRQEIIPVVINIAEPPSPELTIFFDETILNHSFTSYTEDGYSFSTPITLAWNKSAEVLGSTASITYLPVSDSEVWPRGESPVTISLEKLGTSDHSAELHIELGAGAQPGTYSGKIVVEGSSGLEISGEDGQPVETITFFFNVTIPVVPPSVFSSILSYAMWLLIFALVIFSGFILLLMRKYGCGPSEAWARAKSSIVGNSAATFPVGSSIEWTNTADGETGEIKLAGHTEVQVNDSLDHFESFNNELTFVPISGDFGDGIEVLIVGDVNVEISSLGSRQPFAGGAFEPDSLIICGDFELQIHGDFVLVGDLENEIPNNPFDDEDGAYNQLSVDDDFSSKSTGAVEDKEDDWLR
jgi:hypothetical protein